MKNFAVTLSTFLALLKDFTGAKPVFSIDYKKEEILLIYAPSGFIKVLTNVEGANVSLSEKGLTFKLFS